MNICSRSNKQTTFSGQKNSGLIKVNSLNNLIYGIIIFLFDYLLGMKIWSILAEII